MDWSPRTESGWIERFKFKSPEPGTVRVGIYTTPESDRVYVVKGVARLPPDIKGSWTERFHFYALSYYLDDMVEISVHSTQDTDRYISTNGQREKDAARGRNWSHKFSFWVPV